MPECVLDKQFVFIIGSIRSGTTWLQSMMGAHPSVVTTSELTLFEKYVPAWEGFWRDEKETFDLGKGDKGLPKLGGREMLDAHISQFISTVYSKVLDLKPVASHVVDKNPSYSLHISSIRHFFPEARFIHVIRDGRDVVASTLAASRQLGFGATTAERAALDWKKYLVAARKANAGEGRYMEVRYEDLHSAPEQTLAHVFDFCRLSASTEEVADIVRAHTVEKLKAGKTPLAGGRSARHGMVRKGLIGDWREALTPYDLHMVYKRCGRLLQALGYDSTGKWTENVFFRKWVSGVLSLRQRISRTTKDIHNIFRLGGLLPWKSEKAENHTHPNERPSRAVGVLRRVFTKPVLKYLELHLVDHCNLNCQECGHLSPYADKWFLSHEVHIRDMRRLRQLFKNIAVIRLMGGEPLLHPGVTRFIEITRQFFPKADLQLVTNGILIPKMTDELWSACRQNDALVSVTIYPPFFGDKAQTIRNILAKQHVRMAMVRKTVFHSHRNLNGNSCPEKAMNSCRARYYCPFLRDGQIYVCASPALVDLINRSLNVNMPRESGIDLHERGMNGWKLLDKLNQPVQACRFCKYTYDNQEWAHSGLGGRSQI